MWQPASNVNNIQTVTEIGVRHNQKKRRYHCNFIRIYLICKLYKKERRDKIR